MSYEQCDSKCLYKLNILYFSSQSYNKRLGSMSEIVKCQLWDQNLLALNSVCLSTLLEQGGQVNIRENNNFNLSDLFIPNSNKISTFLFIALYFFLQNLFIRRATKLSLMFARSKKRFLEKSLLIIYKKNIIAKCLFSCIITFRK